MMDGHVHSEWSWDAIAGSMEGTCARAVEIGLSTVAFTEHADFTITTLPDGSPLVPVKLDLDGYRQCLERCRERYPQLRIVFGVELSEPHWHSAATADLLRQANFDRVLGSVHSIQMGPDRFVDACAAHAEMPPAKVVRDYLAEVVRMIEASTVFEALAHIDYPVRAWPGVFAAQDFEYEFRMALHALSRAGKLLEVNTKEQMLDPLVLRWWREAGGTRVCLGSDAHEPARLARMFPEAIALVEAQGLSWM